MKGHGRLILLCLLVLSLMTLAPPAGAHPEFGGHDASDPTGPDQHTRNLRLLANVPREGEVTQSDLAFDGDLVYAGNYNGFRVIDVSRPARPQVITSFQCPGAQGDVSVYGGLLFRSVDSPRSNATCDSTPVTASTPGAFEGIQIFDVSNPAAPALVNTVATDCGSHTHTLVPDRRRHRVFLYISSYPLGNASLGPNCQQPHGYISIVEVPLRNPTRTSVTRYHLDPGTELATYPLGEIFGNPALGTFTFSACHDISVFVELDLAAAACLSEAQLWDISDPAHPRFLWRFDDPALDPRKLDLWHSSSFSWDGEVVAFGDESGGGAFPRCTDPNDEQGRVWFLDTETGEFLANYKPPRSIPGVCTMHNFNFVPLPNGRKVLVSAAYTGGTTVVDVDRLIAGGSEAESEIAFYQASNADTWSSYWYNRVIYANDINRGLDTFRLIHPITLRARRLPYLNPQTQEHVIH